MRRGAAAATWQWDDDPGLSIVARNLGTRYVGIAVEAIAGLVVLPFNIHHVGTAAYGLWMLAASVTVYFSVLDLGYGGALVRFVAKYRVRRDAVAINEILSTLFFVFAAIGMAAYTVAVIVALRLGGWFGLAPDHAVLARDILLIVAAQVSLGFCFTVFGAVINGFQRYHVNNLVGATTSAVAAVANLVVLGAGYGLVTVVAVTTAIRIVALFIYRANAYRVFPLLQIRPRFFRAARLREVTGFSVFMLLLDWANKINYSVDAFVVGGFLGAAAVATWTVAQRLAELAQRMTNQLNDLLFPAIVDSDESRRQDRLRLIFLSATRVSLATVVPVAVALFLLARPLITAWVGLQFDPSVRATQLLAVVVAVRVGNATANGVLKGAGFHRLLTATNLSTAALNLVLSVVLVRPLGLAGVALGTLIPITAAALLISFPAACRRAGVPLRQAASNAVWPAVWPALAMAAWLLASRDWLATSLAGVVVDGAIGGLIFLALFVAIALPVDERRVAVAELRRWLRRERVPAATQG